MNTLKSSQRIILKYCFSEVKDIVNTSIFIYFIKHINKSKWLSFQFNYICSKIKNLMKLKVVTQVITVLTFCHFFQLSTFRKIVLIPTLFPFFKYKYFLSY